MRVLTAVTNAMPFFVAVLAVFAFIPWIMGIPGSNGSFYARGWEIGLYAIVFYPVAYAIFASLDQLARRGWLGRRAMPFRTLVWTSLAAFLGAQAYAWSLILSR